MCWVWVSYINDEVWVWNWVWKNMLTFPDVLVWSTEGVLEGKPKYWYSHDRHRTFSDDFYAEHGAFDYFYFVKFVDGGWSRSIDLESFLRNLKGVCTARTELRKYRIKCVLNIHVNKKRSWQHFTKQQDHGPHRSPEEHYPAVKLCI